MLVNKPEIPVRKMAASGGKRGREKERKKREKTRISRRVGEKGKQKEGWNGDGGKVSVVNERPTQNRVYFSEPLRKGCQ